MRQFIVYTLALVVVSLGGCAPERPDDHTRADESEARERELVAEIDGEPISLQDFKQRIDRLPSWGQARLGTVEARKQHLAAVADFEVLADEAVRRGYEDDPRTLRRLKMSLADGERERRERAGEPLPSRDSMKVEVDQDAVDRVTKTEKK